MAKVAAESQEYPPVPKMFIHTLPDRCAARIIHRRNHTRCFDEIVPRNWKLRISPTILTEITHMDPSATGANEIEAV